MEPEETTPQDTSNNYCCEMCGQALPPPIPPAEQLRPEEPQAKISAEEMKRIAATDQFKEFMNETAGFASHYFCCLLAKGLPIDIATGLLVNWHSIVWQLNYRGSIG